MSQESWQRVRSLLESALELDSSSRSEFLDRECSDPSLRCEVESLIQMHEQAGADFLDAPAIASILEEEDARFPMKAGQLIGSYQILEEIAQGGMGAVYRARRADGQYTQQVALKIVRAGFGAELIAARFRNERQILASLDHPNIARILDGGAAVDGSPYYVMELIDGLPINEFCDRHRLSVDARLKLFLQVCAAVQYAHQRLVIHRDIKPSNILITAEGLPKLLDFGIAKVLDSKVHLRDLTVTTPGLWMMTPEYASPEQLRGEAVTTSTDVYSLGLVLYELLTGRRAYRLDDRQPYEFAKIACESDARKPSSIVLARPDAPASQATPEQLSASRAATPAKLHRKLAGDLDNIVLMALRKEPARRYSSVEQFMGDIRCYLENLPVMARNDTPWYRARKFASRHRGGVAVSAVVAVLILSALVATLYEARVARQQAEVARQQHLRAEQRFNDVRKLANSLMFEIHDSIRDLPGATPARKLLIDRALEYLDSLSKEANGDLSLQRELAAAYDRVGDLLGYNGAANLGDFAGARHSYLKALAIRETAAAANPHDIRAQADLINDYFRLAFVLEDAGEYQEALDELHKALPIAQKLAGANDDPAYQDWLAGVYWKSGNILLDTRDANRALADFRRSAAIREPIALDPKANPVFRTHLAGDYTGLGTSLAQTGDLEHAVENTQKAVALLESLSQADPNNATLREYLGEAYDAHSSFLKKRGQLDNAVAYGRKSQEVFDALHAADPSNSLARDNLALSALNLADTLTSQKKPLEAQPFLQQAIAQLEPIAKKNRYELAGLTTCYFTQAKIFMLLAQRAHRGSEKKGYLLQARSWYQKSLETSRQTSQDIAQPDAPALASIQRESDTCEAELAKL
jgi:serine/threonine protein kinase/tetratricopeptide (TPR) repeat protein